MILLVTSTNTWQSISSLIFCSAEDWIWEDKAPAGSTLSTNNQRHGKLDLDGLSFLRTFKANPYVFHCQDGSFTVVIRNARNYFPMQTMEDVPKGPQTSSCSSHGAPESERVPWHMSSYVHHAVFLASAGGHNLRSPWKWPFGEWKRKRNYCLMS